jgi:uncharacterized protein YtpQ (UPF0354 family)
VHCTRTYRDSRNVYITFLVASFLKPDGALAVSLAPPDIVFTSSLLNSTSYHMIASFAIGYIIYGQVHNLK